MSKSSKGKIFTSGGYDAAGWLYPMGFTRADNIKEADVVMFPGGADISPSLYKERPGSRTGASVSRDRFEVEDFLYALEHKKKIAGICRGLQLICALSGGKLIQHVSNHNGTHGIMYHTNVVSNEQRKNTLFSGHNIVADDLGNVKVNSIHHQMIYPYNLPKEDYLIIAHTPHLISTTYLDGNDKEMELPPDFVEIEVCKFHKTNALGWQYHPEMMYDGKPYAHALEFTRNTFMKFYNDEI